MAGQAFVEAGPDLNLALPQIVEIGLLTDLLGDLPETMVAPPILLPPASRPATVPLPAPLAA
jgi:hypothetical protein